MLNEVLIVDSHSQSVQIMVKLFEGINIESDIFSGTWEAVHAAVERVTFID